MTPPDIPEEVPAKANANFKIKDEFQEEIDRLRGEARGRHYAFVQFLTVVCGVMLGLSVRLQNEAPPNQLRESLSLFSLVGLTLSTIAGAIALYGDKNAYDHRWKWMVRLRKKHGNNEIQLKEEFDTRPLLQPPAIHRRAFHIQWLSALAGVLLLLSAKALPLFQLTTNNQPPPPREVLQERETPPATTPKQPGEETLKVGD